MDECASAELVRGRALAGNAHQGGKRQVTILARERWERLTAGLGASLDPGVRRANLLVAGLDLEQSAGRVLRVGSSRLLVHGETRPCEQMEDAWPGLHEAMQTPWSGGAFAEVLEGGEIHVGDRVEWE